MRPGVEVSWCSTIRIGGSMAPISIPARLGFSRCIARSRYAGAHRLGPIPLGPHPLFRSFGNDIARIDPAETLAPALLASDELEQEVMRGHAERRGSHRLPPPRRSA